MEPVSVVCMRWGTLYPPVYVNKLYQMVKRHLKRPFTFYCVTDDPTDLLKEVKVVPMPEIYVSPEDKVWGWRKLGVFSREMPFKGQVLFLDLDLVILDSIDSFFNFKGQFMIIENWSQRGRGIGNSSVFCFEAGTCHNVFDTYMENPQEVMRSYISEQLFISKTVAPGLLHFWPDGWCQSFKRHCVPSRFLRFKRVSMPLDAKILVFHGNPKPPDVIAGKWPGCWPPLMRKISWLENYWGASPPLDSRRKVA